MYLEIEQNSFKICSSNGIKKPLSFNIEQSFISVKEPLFETIRAQDGKYLNLELHQARVDNAYSSYYQEEPKIELKNLLKEPPNSDLYRVKVIYNSDGLVDISHHKYRKKEITKLLLVEVNIEYKFKYLTRDTFNNLKNKFSNYDEIIIVKNGYISDTTIANIALYHKDKKEWHTPKKPLLKGTTLTKLLSRGKLREEDIEYKDLKNYNKIATINAMVGFNELYRV